MIHNTDYYKLIHNTEYHNPIGSKRALTLKFVMYVFLYIYINDQDTAFMCCRTFGV
jgi:hypothetical protein